MTDEQRTVDQKLPIEMGWEGKGMNAEEGKADMHMRE